MRELHGGGTTCRETSVEEEVRSRQQVVLGRLSRNTVLVFYTSVVAQKTSVLWITVQSLAYLLSAEAQAEMYSAF